MRDEAVVRHDCTMWALVAELEAAKTEREAMKAANLERENRGAGPAYGDRAFFQVMEELQRIAGELREL